MFVCVCVSSTETFFSQTASDRIGKMSDPNKWIQGDLVCTLLVFKECDPHSSSAPAIEMLRFGQRLSGGLAH